MARGGSRPGAGRPRKHPVAAPAPAPAAGHVDAAGVKKPDAPDEWPFGREPEPPPAPPAKDLSELTPLDFLLDVMRNELEDKRLRIQAAQLAAPYVHAKKGEGGKKAEKQAAADKLAGGKFATAAPPKLVVNNGKG